MRCTTCDRHLHVRETRCPFCGVECGVRPRGWGPVCQVAVLSVAGMVSCVRPGADDTATYGDSHNSGVAYGPPSYTFTESETAGDESTSGTTGDEDTSGTQGMEDTGTTGCSDTDAGSETAGTSGADDCDTSGTDGGDTSGGDTSSAGETNTGTTSG